MCDVQHILSTASLLLDNLVAWIQLYFHTALAVGNISDLGLARSNCYRSAAPAHLPALPRSTKLTPRMCRRSSGVRTVTICPIFCHISRKGGGSQTISAVNCFQPGCENTRLCQEVVLDDTLKFSSSLSALQQGHWALLEELNLGSSQYQKHKGIKCQLSRKLASFPKISEANLTNPPKEP